MQPDIIQIKGTREITKRELALGILSKKFYHGDNSEIRYMDQGEIVSFDLYNKKSDFNWEFYLNGNKSRRIWFSQLNGYYLFREGNDVYMCALVLKNSEPESIAFLSPEEFWSKVKGKRFKVSLDNDKYEIDRWHPRCQGRTVLDIVTEICKALDEERYSDMKGMTKPKTIYTLEEV
jgi:hypothetical protein